MHLLRLQHSPHFVISRQPAKYLLGCAKQTDTTTNLFVDLEKFCYTSINANTLPLVQVWLCVSWADTFVMTGSSMKSQKFREDVIAEDRNHLRTILIG